MGTASHRALAGRWPPAPRRLRRLQAAWNDIDLIVDAPLRAAVAPIAATHAVFRTRQQVCLVDRPLSGREREASAASAASTDQHRLPELPDVTIYCEILARVIFAIYAQQPQGSIESI